MRSDAQETRRSLLGAAERIVLRDGVAKLTLDAVAQEAGVSKGGVLYHFAGKRALIEAMLADRMDRFDEEVDAQLISAARAGVEPEAGRWLRAFIRASFTPSDPDVADASAALLAVVATDTSLLHVYRERAAAWQARAEQDGIDPALATVLRLAADGLWLNELLGLDGLSNPGRERAIEQMLRMATPAPETKERE